MLVLTRKKGQRILISGDIVITCLGVGSHGEIRIGIDAPRSIEIVREEIARQTCDEEEYLSTDSVGNAVNNPVIVSYKPKVKTWKDL